MKRYFYLILIVLGVMCMTGCSSKYKKFKNEYDLHEKQCAKLVEIIKTQDSLKMKELFSINTLNTKKNINNDIDELFNFIDKNYVNYKSDIGVTEAYFNDDNSSYVRVDSNILYNTSLNTYLINFQTYFLNESNSNEEGITGIFVKKIEINNNIDFLPMNYETYKNGDFLEGIFIENKYHDKENNKINNLIVALNEKNEYSVLKQFSTNAQVNLTNINDLFDYIDGTIIEWYGDIEYLNFGLSDGVDSEYIRANSIYILKTENKAYCLGVQSVITDDKNCNNIGINTLIISQLDEYDIDFNIYNDIFIYHELLGIVGMSPSKWDNGIHCIH